MAAQTENSKSPQEEAEQIAAEKIKASFLKRDEVIDEVLQTIEDASLDDEEKNGDDKPPLSEEEISVIVDRLWTQRLSEQESWPEKTDVDKLEHAFERLAEERSILTRMNFTCCQTCGVSEVWDEKREGDRGFTFFHEQDLERVLGGSELTLAFGSFGELEEKDVEVGRIVVEELKKVGFKVSWEGDAGRRIVVEMKWQRRLPVEETSEESE